MMKALHHIGYWVDDLDTAMNQWSRDLGVGPFNVIEHVPFEEFVLAHDGRARHGKARADGGARDDVVFDHSAAFAAWGPVVIELGQVHAIDDRLAAAYDVTPGAISHVCWVVPDIKQESALCSAGGARAAEAAGPQAVRQALHQALAQFQDPETGTVTLRNTFRWVAATHL